MRIGYIVMYPNDPKYKSMDVYLQLIDQGKGPIPRLVHTPEEASAASDEDSACKLAALYPYLAGKDHLSAVVKAVHRETKLVLKDI